jgi:hypothetical protein
MVVDRKEIDIRASYGRIAVRAGSEITKSINQSIKIKEMGIER